MSRICVKNLPKHVVEDRLREVFSLQGEITDAKLMRTKDGKSRQFAFIGFRTEREAKEAIKHFNKSYLDTFRITCEIARKVGDPEIPRPWSRYSLKRQQEKVTEDGKKNADDKSSCHDGAKGGKKSLDESNNVDPKLQEFLQIMQPRVKSKMWANDMVIDSSSNRNTKISNKESVTKEQNEKSTSPHGELNKAKSMDDEMEKIQNLTQDEVISDMDYFKSRVNKDWSDSENDDGVANGDNTDNYCDVNSTKETVDKQGTQINLEEQRDNLSKDAEQEQVEEGPSEDTRGEILDPGNSSSSLKENSDQVLETGRLFVRNLPYTATEDELEELFRKFGEVSEVHIVLDKDTKRSKGIAYVLYSVPESAVRAQEELDSSIFQGRLLHVMPAKLKHPLEKQENNMSFEGQKTFKQKREEGRKAAEGSGDTKAWNSLFMRADTVVEYLARKYGVSKSDLLDREADDLAVRIALGETQVIAETKKALDNSGVNVSAMEEFAAGRAGGMKRSNHVLLVKNLPYGSSETELAKMFGKFGSLDKIIFPPTRTLALVVFLEPAEARAAFKGLAYKRYKDVPLYLEWAPENILSQNSSENNNKNSAVIGEQEAKRAILKQHVEGISDVDLDPDRIESRSLFVKNLNFTTSDESLKRHFGEQIKEGKILSVRVKKHLKNGKQLSMGFGFIEFDSVETAKNVCKDLQGTVLDGHALILQLCQAKKDEQAAKDGAKDKSSSKLLVRNVAFEATVKDLRQLFSPFGKIKSLRLPKKFGNHRGFAFVEFVTKQEARNALKALSNTHLYGRHLVLERAKESETLEELRARTAAQFTDEQSGFQNPAKLSRKRKHMAILDDGRMKFEGIAG